MTHTHTHTHTHQVCRETLLSGQYPANSTTIDDQIAHHIAQASSSFGMLRQRLCDEHCFRLRTKVNVYKAVVLTSLLYSCETWTTYRCHTKLLEQFHQRCLKSICGIKWQDKVSRALWCPQCGKPDHQGAASLGRTGMSPEWQIQEYPKRFS